MSNRRDNIMGRVIFFGILTIMSLPLIVAIIAALSLMTTSYATCLFYIGYGLVCISVGAAFVTGTYSLSKITFKGIQKMLGRFLIRRGSK